jgi:hypothetical protein
MKKLFVLTVFLFASHQAMSDQEFKKVTGIPEGVKSAKAIIPIYSQKLAFRIPTTWKSAFQDQKPSMFMMEFTPKNESIDSWQNLLTIQGYENLSGRVTPERFLTDTGNRFKAICTNDFVFDNLGATTVDGFKAHRAILGCSKVPGQNFSEVAYWLVIQGYKDIYVVQKAVRSTSGNQLNSSNVDSFIADIGPIELCKAGGQQYECNK